MGVIESTPRFSRPEADILTDAEKEKLLLLIGTVDFSHLVHQYMFPGAFLEESLEYPGTLQWTYPGFQGHSPPGAPVMDWEAACQKALLEWEIWWEPADVPKVSSLPRPTHNAPTDVSKVDTTKPRVIDILKKWARELLKLLASLPSSSQPTPMVDPAPTAPKTLVDHLQKEHEKGHDLAERFFNIGLCNIDYLPTSIQIIKQTDFKAYPRLRDRGTDKVNRGNIRDVLRIDFVVFNIEELEMLVRQFRNTPFVAINNTYINGSLGITDVALQSINVSAVPNFPGLFMCAIQLLPFDFYTIGFNPNMAMSIDYDMYRWYLEDFIPSKYVRTRFKDGQVVEEPISLDSFDPPAELDYVFEVVPEEFIKELNEVLRMQREYAYSLAINGVELYDDKSIFADFSGPEDLLTIKDFLDGIYRDGFTEEWAKEHKLRAAETPHGAWEDEIDLESSPEALADIIDRWPHLVNNLQIEANVPGIIMLAKPWGLPGWDAWINTVAAITDETARVRAFAKLIRNIEREEKDPNVVQQWRRFCQTVLRDISFALPPTALTNNLGGLLGALISVYSTATMLDQIKEGDLPQCFADLVDPWFYRQNYETYVLPDTYMVGFGAALENNFATVHTQSKKTISPVYQHLGSGDVVFSVKFRSTNEDDIALLYSIYEGTQYILKNYDKQLMMGFVGFRCKYLSKLFKVREFIITNMTMRSVEEQPNLYEIDLQLVEYDIEQKVRAIPKELDYEPVHRERTGLTDLTMLDGRNSQDVIDINKGWFKIREGLIEHSNYPDIVLPLWSELEAAGYTPGYEPLLTYFYKDEYVDPDFYIIYDPKDMPQEGEQEGETRVDYGEGSDPEQMTADEVNKNIMTMTGRTSLVKETEEEKETMVSFGLQNKDASRHFIDYNRYDVSNRLVQLFPAFHFIIAQEFVVHFGYRISDNFYGANRILRINVDRDGATSQDTAEVILSNVHGYYQNPIADLGILHSSNMSFVGKYSQDFMTELGNIISHISFGTLFGKGWVRKDIQEILKKVTDEQTFAYDISHSIFLKPGHRIRIAMGYGANPERLPVVFSGKVTEVNGGGAQLRVICQSDTVELLNKMNDSIKMSEEVDLDSINPVTKDTLNVWDLIFNTRGGLGLIGQLAAGAYPRQSYDNPFGIQHFGLSAAKGESSLAEARATYRKQEETKALVSFGDHEIGAIVENFSRSRNINVNQAWLAFLDGVSVHWQTNKPLDDPSLWPTLIKRSDTRYGTLRLDNTLTATQDEIRKYFALWALEHGTPVATYEDKTYTGQHQGMSHRITVLEFGLPTISLGEKLTYYVYERYHFDPSVYGTAYGTYMDVGTFPDTNRLSTLWVPRDSQEAKDLANLRQKIVDDALRTTKDVGGDFPDEPGFNMAAGWRPFCVPEDRIKTLGKYGEIFINIYDPINLTLTSPADVDAAAPSTTDPSAFAALPVIAAQAAPGAAHAGKVAQEINYRPENIFDKSVWDVLKTYQWSTPDYIVAARPFENRSTLFYGLARYEHCYEYFNPGVPREQTYTPDPNTLPSTTESWFAGLLTPDDPDTASYSQMRVPKEEREFNKICARWKPFMQAHIFADHNIVMNSVVASSRYLFNVITPLSSVGKSKGDQRVYVDAGIVPAEQKITILETGIRTNAWENMFGGLVANVAFHWNWDDMIMVAIGALRDHMREMYQGQISIIGDTSIQPFDLGLLNDPDTGMTGLFEVGRVTHIFSADLGMHTAVKPNLMTQAFDPYAFPLISLLFAMGTRIMADNEVTTTAAQVTNNALTGILASVAKYATGNPHGTGYKGLAGLGGGIGIDLGVAKIWPKWTMASIFKSLATETGASLHPLNSSVSYRMGKGTVGVVKSMWTAGPKIVGLWKEVKAAEGLAKVGIPLGRGLAGTGKGVVNAFKSARTLGQLNPVGVVLTVLGLGVTGILGKIISKLTATRCISMYPMLLNCGEFSAGIDGHGGSVVGEPVTTKASKSTKGVLDVLSFFFFADTSTIERFDSVSYGPNIVKTMCAGMAATSTAKDRPTGSAGSAGMVFPSTSGDTNLKGIPTIVEGTPAMTAVLEMAQSQVGVKEGPNNTGDAVTAYLATTGLGTGYAWCAAFVSWCIVKAEETVGSTGLPHSASPIPYKTSAESAGRWVPIEYVQNVPRGAIVIFRTTASNSGYHIGIAEYSTPGIISTIEGNTGDGLVARREYLASNKYTKTWSGNYKKIIGIIVY